MSEVTAQRNSGTDRLRGLAILGVAWIHGHVAFSGMSSQWDWLSNWFRWGVPAFIFLAAYYSVGSLRKVPSGVSYIRSRIGKLAIPFLFWSILYLFLFADLSHLTPSSLITSHFMGRGWSGQYFFLLMFQLTLFAPFLLRLTWTGKRLLAVYAGTVFIYLAVLLVPVHIGILGKLSNLPILYWVAYIALGAFLAQQNSVRERLHQAVVNRPWLGYAALLSPLLIAAESALKGGKEFGMFRDDYIQLSVLAAATLMCTFGWFYLGTLRSSFATKTLEELGRNSFGIFCLNPLFAFLFSLIERRISYYDFAPLWLRFVAPLLVVPLIVWLCLLAIQILRKLRLSALVY